MIKVILRSSTASDSPKLTTRNLAVVKTVDSVEVSTGNQLPLLALQLDAEPTFGNLGLCKAS